MSNNTATSSKDSELLQRLCNNAMSRILDDSAASNPILCSFFAAFATMMTRRADKETQTGMEVTARSESWHLENGMSLL